MFHYKAFGLEIQSEIELPGMIPGSGNSDIRIVLGKVDPYLVLGAEVEGPNYLVKGDDVYLWWDDIGKVRIREGKQVTVEPVADIYCYDEVNIIPSILGPVMAFLLYQRGFLVLHGSSVKVWGEAVAFLGHRGNGKSTTAIHLYTKGYPLVADDILAIKFDDDGFPMVHPGYPHVRLGEDSYNQVKGQTDILSPIRTIAGKVFCDASFGFSPDPVKLKKIYIIEKGEKIRISFLESQKTVIDLIRHSTANKIFQRTTQADNLAKYALLINNISVRRFEISHSFQKIHNIISLVEDDFSS